MKNKKKDSPGTPSRFEGVISRFFLFSAFLGFLIGLFEAYLLWTTPRAIPLLIPDVGWVIWFLAPFVDMIFFALLGLAIGWLARRVRGKEAPAALEAALAITFVIFIVVWFHGGFAIFPLDFARDVGFPLIVLAFVFAVSLLILPVVWKRFAAFAELWIDSVLRPLAWGLVAAAVVAIVGICAFVLWPPISGPALPPSVAPPSDAPNIVFITLDTVRADHLSSYGYSRPTTPNLDRFARTGVLFKNAIAPSSWTLTSHASMFTGLLPQQHGAESFVPMASGTRTLAQILRSEGYQTAGFIGNPTYLERGWNIARGFSAYDDATVSLGNNLAQTLLGTAIIQPLFQVLWESGLTQLNCWFYRRSASDLNRTVSAWVRQHQHRAYFLFINYIDAHDPYFTPQRSENRFGKLPPAVARKLAVDLGTGYRAGFTPGQRALLVDGYDNCLAYLDGQVGKLLSVLRQLPRWQKTVVIITADHGEEFGGHGDYIHGLDLYRALLHVPLIIAGPGIPRDTRISHLVGTRQLFSTVLDLAGGGHTPFSRTSLARFWNPAFKPLPFDDAVVSEDIPTYGSDAWHPMASLTTPKWQYVVHQDGRQELYDWIADPEERNNLAGSPREQVPLAGLCSRLDSLMTNAVGPWNGAKYLQALDGVGGPSRLALLYPHPIQPGAAATPFRIGIAQAYFKSQTSPPTRPSRSEQEILQSLPYR